MLVPNLRDMAEVMTISGYSEETILDFGLTGGLVFIIVVPLVGACKVPPEALSHFMAGEEQFTAKEMPEHYTGCLSGEWVIKRERLRILAESWDGLSAALLDMADGLDRASLPSIKTPDGYCTIEQASQALSVQRGCNADIAKAMERQFLECARDGGLYVRDPQTLCVYQPSTIREDYDLVTVDDINAFLETVKAPYRWSPAPPLVKVPHKSPRDFKPWETLVPFFEPINGLYMYQQAAREIADAEGWNDSKLEALEAEMISAVNNGLLPIRSRKTGMVIAADSLDALALVTLDDVNEWLERNRVPYRWALQSEAIDLKQTETPEQRRARYLELFELEKKSGARGALARVAASEGVDRSNMSKDIKKAREARTAALRAGTGMVSQLVRSGKRKGGHTP